MHTAGLGALWVAGPKSPTHREAIQSSWGNGRGWGGVWGTRPCSRPSGKRSSQFAVISNAPVHLAVGGTLLLHRPERRMGSRKCPKSGAAGNGPCLNSWPEGARGKCPLGRSGCGP